MAAAGFTGGVAEALILGLSTGPVCLAACGPAVTPWLLTQPRGVRQHTWQLALFLAARLAAYLVFACLVWAAGSALLRAWSGRSWVTGAVDLLLALVLVFYAAGWRGFHWRLWRPKQELVRIGESPRLLRGGALALGFLTGVNLCPPFVVAGVQAAGLESLTRALLFFLLFFVGTSVWFVPFVLLGFLRRSENLLLVARITAVLLACWYGYFGVSILLERIFYG